jgi:hypothetical protein
MPTADSDGGGDLNRNKKDGWTNKEKARERERERRRMKDKTLSLSLFLPSSPFLLFFI